MSARRIASRRGPVAACAVAALFACTALGAGASLAAPARAAVAGTEEASEYEVKAHFLAHFIKYTTWPKQAFANDEAPFVLLVVGEDPFGAQLEKVLAGKKGAGRPVRISRMRSLDELPAAHLVFLARSHAGELARLLDGASARHALVVGDHEGLAEGGAHVNLYLDGKKLRFEVNEQAVKRSQLSINPEMLKLARLVEDRRKKQDP